MLSRVRSCMRRTHRAECVGGNPHYSSWRWALLFPTRCWCRTRACADEPEPGDPTIAAATSPSGDGAEDPTATLSVAPENGSVEAEPEGAPQTQPLNEVSGAMTVVNVTHGPAQEE